MYQNSFWKRETIQENSPTPKSWQPMFQVIRFSLSRKKNIVSAVLSPCVPSYDDHAKRCHSSFHPFSLVFSYNVFSSALMHTYMVFTFSCIIIPFRSFVPSISHVFNLLAFVRWLFLVVGRFWQQCYSLHSLLLLLYFLSFFQDLERHPVNGGVMAI